METYVLDQYGMDDLLEGYEEYAQFLVGVELVDESEKASTEIRQVEK
jgi:hypothetical protein